VIQRTAVNTVKRFIVKLSCGMVNRFRDRPDDQDRYNKTLRDGRKTAIAEAACAENTKYAASQRIARNAEAMKSFPSSRRYASALQAIEAAMSSGHRAMLEVLYQASDYPLTTFQLASAARYKSWQGACLQFGLLAKRLCEALSFEPPQRYKNGLPIWSFVLAAAPKTPTAGYWQWILRPEAVQALTRLKWFDKSDRQRFLQAIHRSERRTP
jgi:hypothetical protein